MIQAIQTQNLSRAFGAITAVEALSLAVPQGSVFGFLGPNGAGKTTTIRMLLSLIKPSTGRIHLNGYDLMKERSKALCRVGAIVESPALYPNLTGREIMAMAARMTGRPLKDGLELLDQVRLTDAMNRQVSSYSLGMRQRLALARAMLGDPKLLILDEPTNGLDPAGIADMRALIRALPEKLGATVFLSSHLLSEIEQTASHCALIDRGRLVFQDRLTKLSQMTPSIMVIETDRPSSLVKRFLENNVHADADGALVRAQVQLSMHERVSLNQALLDEGYQIASFWEEKPTLENVFLKLTGQGRERIQ